MGGARRLRATQPREIAGGRRPCPRARAPLFRGEVRASAVPGIPTRPPGAPGHAHCRRGQGAAPPRLAPLRRAPSSRGPRARAGQAARAADSPPGPAPRPAAPRARPRGHAATGAPRPRAPAAPARGPARLHALGKGVPRCGNPAVFCFAPRSPRTQGGRQERAPARPRCPGTEAAARARSAAVLRGPGCHDCGQRGARARSRAQLGDPRPTDGPWPYRSPVRAADSSQGRPAGPCGGQCAPWSSRRGTSTEFGVVGGNGFPPGQGACQGDPAGAF